MVDVKRLLALIGLGVAFAPLTVVPAVLLAPDVEASVIAAVAVGATWLLCWPPTAAVTLPDGLGVERELLAVAALNAVLYGVLAGVSVLVASLVSGLLAPLGVVTSLFASVLGSIYLRYHHDGPLARR